MVTETSDPKSAKRAPIQVTEAPLRFCAKLVGSPPLWPTGGRRPPRGGGPRAGRPRRPRGRR
eukprot:14296807-Alexandrium_andersonii.AAC.1